MRVVPLARTIGVDDVVDEVPTRLPYSATLEVQKRASMLVALGSSEPHYTASKIFPLLLARRPLLAIYHEQSTVTKVLASLGRPSAIELVTYSDTARAEAKTEAVFASLISLLDRSSSSETTDISRLAEFFAENLAGRLAGVLDRVVLEQRRAA
jgi:hypothetical protein